MKMFYLGQKIFKSVIVVDGVGTCRPTGVGTLAIPVVHKLKRSMFRFSNTTGALFLSADGAISIIPYIDR